MRTCSVVSFGYLKLELMKKRDVHFRYWYISIYPNYHQKTFINLSIVNIQKYQASTRYHALFLTLGLQQKLLSYCGHVMPFLHIFFFTLGIIVCQYKRHMTKVQYSIFLLSLVLFGFTSKNLLPNPNHEDFYVCF